MPAQLARLFPSLNASIGKWKKRPSARSLVLVEQVSVHLLGHDAGADGRAGQTQRKHRRRA
jgi:hypothetical protein